MPRINYYNGNKVKMKETAIPSLTNPPPGTIGTVVGHRKIAKNKYHDDYIILDVMWPAGSVNPPKHLKSSNNVYQISFTKVEKVKE